MNTASSCSRNKIDELHRRIGRNLSRFQGIEQCLRGMLPYIHPDGSRQGSEAQRTYQRAKIDGSSLGILIGQFKESLDGASESFEEGLNYLLKERNDLVHQFYRNPQFDLLIPSGLDAALAYLDEQYEGIGEWAEVIRVNSLVVLLLLIETNPALAAEFGQYREQLMAQMPATLEVINQSEPAKTSWETTRIVKLLKMAESQTEAVNGMTLLARAGKYIRNQMPEITVEHYGLKTYREVLVVSGLFDVVVAADGSTFMYRSKDANGAR